MYPLRLFYLRQSKFFLLFFFFPLFSIYAVIHQVENFDKIREELNTLNENSLVIFDVDEVILQPRDPILRDANLPLRLKLLQKYFAHLSENEWLKAMSRTRLKKDWSVLIDPDLPSLIKDLQKKNIKVMALTALEERSFGLIPSLINWRIENLKYLDIDFHLTFPHIPELILNGKHFDKKFPLFKSGVLCSRPYPKGLVLYAFLEQIHYRPERVIFVDDLIENVESVATYLDKLQIPFLGLHYMGASLSPCLINEKIADFQFRYLLEKEAWLSETEAQEFILQ